ncbi:hypothetical protein [Plasmodium yoelii yoelii]|uniref:Uncharacterized protein n=1 Tax=Plasmodium yoelii yoelii TaxID=73239 RepID=Q7RMD3_PLAYO|nr:hypothetical protein [Plasmodium yoelii yoelii]
MYIRVHSGSKK